MWNRWPHSSPCTSAALSSSIVSKQIVQSAMESSRCIQKDKETGREKLKLNFVRVACRKHSCPRTTHHVHDLASPGRPSRAAREPGKGANNPGPPGVPAGAPFESHPEDLRREEAKLRARVEKIWDGSVANAYRQSADAFFPRGLAVYMSGFVSIRLDGFVTSTVARFY